MTDTRYAGAPHYQRTVLANGLRVLTERLEHVDSVSLGIWVTGGSRNEPAGLEGITHFLEHILFKGTDTRTAEDIARLVDDIGGNVNGYTERESLYLLARTVADQAQTALDLLFDMLLHSACGDEELEREKEVVLQEIRHVEDTPEDWVHDLLLQTAWENHPLGRQLLGRPESIRKLACNTLADYCRQMCAGQRMVVSAAGRVDHDQMVKLVESYAGGLPRGTAVEAKPQPEFHPGKRMVSRPTGQAHFCIATPACGWDDERRHAYSILDTILGGGASSRLFQEIREKRGLVYHIGSYLQAYHGAGLLTVDAGVGPENLDLVLNLADNEIARLRQKGPTAEEVERAKTQLKVGLALATESTSFRMQHLALSELIWNRVWPFGEVVERVERVTAEEVHALAQSAFTEDRRVLVAIGPFAEGGG